MRIDRVKLKNVGPHHKLHVKLQSGLIGLVGRNGAGKSTLVNSIYAALTNDYSRFAAVKADIITNNTGKEQSSIHIAGEHHGQKFELTRWLRPNKAELVIGEQVYTKSNDINQAIEDQLGISKLLIDKYVFVNQWEMFQFLSQTESERAKTFQYLCGTETAMKIHKVCSDYVSNQKGTEIMDNSIELADAIATAQEQMDRHAAEGRAAKKKILDKAKVAELEKVIKRVEQADEAAESIKHTKQKLGEARLERGKSVTRRSNLKKQLKRDQGIVAALINGPELTAAKELVDDPEDYEELEQQQEQLKESIATKQADIESFEAEKPEKLEDKYLDADAFKNWSDKKVELEFQQTQDGDLIEDFGDKNIEGDQVCPYCQQSITSEHLHEVVEAYKQRAALLIEIKAALKHTIEYNKKMSYCLTNIKRLEDELAEAQRDLEKKNEQLAKKPSPEALTDALELTDKFESAQQRITAANQSLNLLAPKISKYDGQIEGLESQVQTYQRQIDNKPSAVEIKQASDQLDEHKTSKVDHQVAVRCFKEAKQNRTNLKNTLDQLKLRLQQKAKIKDLLNTISEAGDVFHWNNLPKTVSQANLELLVDDINENLSLFNNPFYVEADSDLTFKVYFPGKSPVKAKQLSGGQKVILAVAFRVALDRVFGHDVGMMWFDEPTAGLDADNVEYFHDALQQLAQKMHGNGQLVVITHVQELSGVFDQLIEV